MRAFIVVLALVATPFLAGMSQSPNGSDCDNGQGDEHRSDSGQVHAHQGLCAPQPPPSCGNSDLVTGIATIRGQLFINQPPFALLGGWCVELQDASSGAVVATGHQVAPPGGPVCGANPDLTPRYGFAVTILPTGGDYSFYMFGNLQ